MPFYLFDQTFPFNLKYDARLVRENVEGLTESLYFSVGLDLFSRLIKYLSSIDAAEFRRVSLNHFCLARIMDFRVACEIQMREKRFR